MARRRPFGAKASPPTVDGTSSVRFEPLAVRTQASLPADHASAPAGPAATWSIQRCLASAARMVLSPSASVATTLPSSPPVTMRAASAAEVRTAPSCTETLRGSPPRGTNTSAPSPSTKAAVSLRKCAAATGAPVLTGRVRSTTDGVLARLSVMRLLRPHREERACKVRGLRKLKAAPSRRAAGEAFPDLVLGQLAADEDDAAFTLLARLPWALVVAVENHVHALEHEALVVVLERQDALAAQNVRPLDLHELLHPGEKLVGVERPVGLERDRLHLFVVIVFQSAVVMVGMIMIMPMVVIVVVIVMMVNAIAEEFRLDLHDAVEIEGIAAEHLRQRDPAALGLVQLGVGVDAADARLHLAERVGFDQIGLVEQDHVGERDLVLRLRRVLEAVLQPFGVSDRDHRVELGLAADIVVHEERLRHRRGVREPRGLDDDGVELTLPAHQPVDDAHEVAAHGAADAAVVHLEDFFVGADDEIVVDADLAEFVDNDGVLLPVRLRQNAVEQRGLAGAEIAGKHGDGDLVGHRATPFGPRIYASVGGCHRAAVGVGKGAGLMRLLFRPHPEEGTRAPVSKDGGGLMLRDASQQIGVWADSVTYLLRCSSA